MALTSPENFNSDYLREQVMETYDHVAREPHADYHFHRGPKYASKYLGYDYSELISLPEISTARFAGVGNPIDIGEIEPGMVVLDIASGIGSSAIFLAERFGCQVAGVDYSRASVAAANEAASAAQVAHLVRFQQADAEELPFFAGQFDAIICECAFCTFPDKATAAAEFRRVLAPNGHIGISDLTRQGDLPTELHTLLAWVACIADALPVDEYRTFLEDAGLHVSTVEFHPEALRQLIHDIRGKLVGAELLVKLKQIDLPTTDFAQAKTIARAAANSIESDDLTYTILIAG